MSLGRGRLRLAACSLAALSACSAPRARVGAPDACAADPRFGTNDLPGTPCKLSQPRNRMGCGTPAWSPLGEAARLRDFPAVRCLIEHGADVNARDKSGYTAFHHALDSFTVYWHPKEPDRIELLEYLLAHGADPNLPFSYGVVVQRYTALHYAAYDGDLDLVRMLVDAGARIDATDSRGFTPMHSAARCDFRLSYDLWARDVIAFLVERGGNPHARTIDGQTVLDILVVPSDPVERGAATWPSGYCKHAYDYVKALP